jgi:hypothetical protein
VRSADAARAYTSRQGAALDERLEALSALHLQELERLSLELPAWEGLEVER